MNQQSPTFIQKTLAWSVHLFTASGLVCGFLAILAINEKDWRMAMMWLVVALIVDGVDGTFARIFKAKEILPNVDGKSIDYVIDFATYAIIPAYFFHEAVLVPEVWRFPCTAAILLVSALYYGKQGMVSDDMYFIGFPVMWNMVVFYLVFVWPQIAMLNVALVFIFCVLHFVPIKFVYPSQTTRFFNLTLGATILFFLSLILIVFHYPERKLWTIVISYLCIVYYAGMAIYNTWIEQPQND